MSFMTEKMLFSFLLLAIISGSASVDISRASSDLVGPRTNVVARFKREAPRKEAQITDVYISSSVHSRFATVKVSSKMVNVENTDVEATFSVQMPESAFIANFTMIINDTLQVAEVYEKKKAQEKYDKAKEQGQSAGQVKHKKTDPIRGMDTFNVNVNVAARSDVYFELTYQELLERRLGQYQQRILVQPTQVVDNLTLDLSYNEPQLFDGFDYQKPNSSERMETSSKYVVFTASPTTRHIIYKPSVSRQREMNVDKGIDGEFVVSYDVGHPFDGGNVIYAEENNYFVHYFAIDKSEEIRVMPKNVMFVIDVSGSMTGRKIAQTRDAMKAILPQLREFDFFNIMIFSDNYLIWQNNPVRATTSNINSAKGFVDERVHAGGGTNIDLALKGSVDVVANDPELGGKAGIIVFLTDGQPTSGETKILTIRQNVKRLNENRVGIFTLGFGMGVNFDFLQKISYENGGFARRIYEDEDAASQLTTFFKEVNDPLLVDVHFVYESNQVDDSEVTRTSYKQLFSGTEIVVAGKRLSDRIDAKVQGSTATNAIDLVVPDNSKTQLSGPSGEFTEKLWAYLTIKDLLRKKAIAGSEAEAASLEAQALQMSLDYNFVTPLTSMVVVQEEGNYDNNDEESVYTSKRKPKYRVPASQDYDMFMYVNQESGQDPTGGAAVLSTLLVYYSVFLTTVVSFLMQPRGILVNF